MDDKGSVVWSIMTIIISEREEILLLFIQLRCKNVYLAIDCGRYLCTDCLLALIAMCLNVSKCV